MLGLRYTRSACGAGILPEGKQWKSKFGREIGVASLEYALYAPLNLLPMTTVWASERLWK